VSAARRNQHDAMPRYASVALAICAVTFACAFAVGRAGRAGPAGLVRAEAAHAPAGIAGLGRAAALPALRVAELSRPSPRRAAPHRTSAPASAPAPALSPAPRPVAPAPRPAPRPAPTVNRSPQPTKRPPSGGGPVVVDEG